ncbi:MAG: 16S rRNA (adenine(1518)-N(6)/adenine(1519)-N(6))-dimethyltransferase RsmA [Alphaproteobacteria bacterium]|nr:16S rRNA (adenine(1518)-N(6)/adenine(1519)-N(6))-dimethyltransferase RsmA [Alphaproteobacteria bacterium]
MLDSESVAKIQQLPSIVQTIKAFGLQENKASSKRLGQNFLTDYNVIQKIVRFADDLSNQIVLEVGSGPGGLTRAILEHNPKALHVAELDPKCIPVLQALKIQFQNLHIHHQDALTLDISTFINPGEKIHIVANLPYNVGTALLLNWLKQAHFIASMTLMFQKEVADRITAQPHTAGYGRLSVISQYLCHVDQCMHLSPNLFTPPPKVDSAVVSLRPKTGVDLTLIPYLEQITQHAFGMRRKMIRSSMKSVMTEDALNQLGLDTTLRAENLTLDDYIAIASFMRGNKNEQ